MHRQRIEGPSCCLKGGSGQTTHPGSLSSVDRAVHHLTKRLRGDEASTLRWLFVEKASPREVRETMFRISDSQGCCDARFSGPEGCRTAQQDQAFRRLSRENFLREIFEERSTRLRYRAQKSLMLVGAHAGECIGNEAHRSRATSCEAEDTRNQRAINVANLTADELLDLL